MTDPNSYDHTQPHIKNYGNRWENNQRNYQLLAENHQQMPVRGNTGERDRLIAASYIQQHPSEHQQKSQSHAAITTSDPQHGSQHGSVMVNNWPKGSHINQHSNERAGGMMNITTQTVNYSSDPNAWGTYNPGNVDPQQQVYERDMNQTALTDNFIQQSPNVHSDILTGQHQLDSDGLHLHRQVKPQHKDLYNDNNQSQAENHVKHNREQSSHVQQQIGSNKVSDNQEAVPVVADPSVYQYEHSWSTPAAPTLQEALQNMVCVSEKSNKGHAHCHSHEEYQEMQLAFNEVVISTKTENVNLHEKLNEVNSIAREWKRECEELSKRLSTEMSDKVSSNETSIENVSIKNRPMKIAEEYMNFCSEVWLSAKQLLDDQRGVRDSDKFRMLRHVIKLSWECASLKQNEVMNKLYGLLLNPLEAKHASQTVELQENDPTKVHQSERPNRSQHDADKISSHVQNAVGDHMRNISDTVDLSPLEEAIHAKIAKEYPNFKEFQPLREYIAKLTNLTWKMVNQRPKMSFQFPSKGSNYIESEMDPHWGSSDPKNPRSEVKCCVTPLLLHGDRLMAKGKVLLVNNGGNLHSSNN